MISQQKRFLKNKEKQSSLKSLEAQIIILYIFRHNRLIF